MGKFLNLGILANPLNWVTVVVMCLFGLLLLQMIAPEQ